MPDANGAKPRFWIGVASHDHVIRAVQGGFCQLGHGKAQPARRLKPGDWLAYYSPREGYREGETIQAFTAIGRVKPGEPYVVDQAPGFRPTRRDVHFFKKARQAPL